ncbi:HAD family hydrolase [Halobacillus sp. Marseille-Q1614]|uniref:HAD family hydrolase n=1 Tax=Halobacillus sp. Marseille-Q1614 TaxID=2709134 RepID=UPI00156E6037|nr:HAD family hydrolase [Halobacillus sp. Marseille-Q1614]
MDSIIFDLDGTIWDPIDTVVSAWNSHIESNRELKKLTRSDFEKTMGLQMHEIGRRLFPDLREKERETLINDCCDIEEAYIKKQGGQLYPKVEDVLKELSKRYKLFIVSNCQDGYIEAFYEAHNLDTHFIDYENPGRTGLSKGENINLIMKRNNLSDPVYVGDTEGDLKAARHAGIPFVYAKYGFGKASEYDEVVEQFSDLLKLY